MDIMLKRVRLTKRLASILDMVGDSECVADIGCDHGRLSVALLQATGAKRVIATDISEYSVRKAIKLRDKCNLSCSMEVCCADGFLREYSTPPDCAVIAGMGGILITDILSRGMSICRGLNKIIMQPMRGIAELRRFLHENGFQSLDERLVEDSGRIYQVLSFCFMGVREKFPEGFPDDYYEFGHRMFYAQNSLLPIALESKRKEYSDALESVKSAGRESYDLEKSLFNTNEAIAYLSRI